MLYAKDTMLNPLQGEGAANNAIPMWLYQLGWCRLQQELRPVKIKVEDTCIDCGEPITWGKPMSTGNGNVFETFQIDNIKVNGRSFVGGHAYSFHKNDKVFATVCRGCVVHFEMIKGM